MSPRASDLTRAIVREAGQAATKLRPGALEGRRSLPIRASAGDIRATWEEAELRRLILDGLPVADASLDVGEQDRDWGTTATVRVKLSAPVPGAATQALCGKVVRRLKALCETGEIPTTDFNPSARPDAGEPAS